MKDKRTHCDAVDISSSEQQICSGIPIPFNVQKTGPILPAVAGLTGGREGGREGGRLNIGIELKISKILHRLNS